jgi:hypothetical protein
MKYLFLAVIAAAVVVALLITVNLTGQASRLQDSGSGGNGLNINDVVDVLRVSPDYYEMSQYINCAYTESMLTAQEAEELAESQPVLYGGIHSDVYRIIFVCSGESSGLLVVYDPGSGEVLKTFITSSIVLGQ